MPRRYTKAITAKDLKNSTGEVVRSLRRGESILLTFRGKPLATLEPVSGDAARDVVPSCDEAWAEIERQLTASRPRFRSWREAEGHSRGRR
jgi:prevent-host-death family protein